VSRYQKVETNVDFTETRDSEWQWHQLGRMQVYMLLQTDNHASTPPLSFFRPDALPAAQVLMLLCVCGWVFRDLLEEVVPLMKEAIDRKAENPRRKKRRDVLRLSLLRVLLYMANNGIFTRWLVTRPY